MLSWEQVAVKTHMNREHPYSGLFVFEREKRIALLYHLGVGRAAALGLAESNDGANFVSTRKAVAFVSKTGSKRSIEEASAFRVSRIGKELLLSFLTGSDGILGIAASRTGLEWKIITSVRGFSHPTVFTTLPKSTGKNLKKTPADIAAFSGSGRKFVTLATSDKTFGKWDDRGVVLEARPSHFDASSIVPMYAAATKQGILLTYTAKNQQGLLVVGAAIFDPEHPETLLWRSSAPLWTAPASWYGKSASVLGGAQIGKYFYGYFQRENEDVETFPMSRLWETYIPIPAAKTKKKAPAKKIAKKVVPAELPHRLARHPKNPIIEPREEHSWESLATFNSAALELDGKVHLLYRAQGHDGVSVLGYALSRTGVTVDERSSDPAFVPSQPFEIRKKGTLRTPLPYVSGGGWGGCEDPRITRIGSTIYLIYVAFDGAHLPGVALTSIRESDFLKKRWAWRTPQLISRPGEIQKNWVIFPEKVRGKYAILHGVSPNISIEYLDSLDDFDGSKHIKSLPSHGGAGYRETDRQHHWDNIMRGAGAPPIRTERGWVVLYHAMDYRDPGKYKIGAMLLDLESPEKILHRSPEPILEPEAEYENNGHKQGVVYACGAVVKDGTLFVYYGASDKTLAVATAPTRQLSRCAHAQPPLPPEKDYPHIVRPKPKHLLSFTSPSCRSSNDHSKIPSSSPKATSPGRPKAPSTAAPSGRKPKRISYTGRSRSRCSMTMGLGFRCPRSVTRKAKTVSTSGIIARSSCRKKRGIGMDARIHA
jgi:beta-1,2-mannobiose phosphorylase / 1,2-beta-oligomannan phosphorylase